MDTVIELIKMLLVAVGIGTLIGVTFGTAILIIKFFDSLL